MEDNARYLEWKRVRISDFLISDSGSHNRFPGLWIFNNKQSNNKLQTPCRHFDNQFILKAVF